MSEGYNEPKLEELKKELANQLMQNLKLCDDNIIDDLIRHGYSSFEIIQMLTKYEETSGLDLINCNEVVKETLGR